MTTLINKKIYSFFGNQDQLAIDLLKSKGYQIHSILEPIEKFRKSLNNRENNEYTIDQVRERGYYASELIWIHMLLSSLDKNKTRFVLTDLALNDLTDAIKPVYITDEYNDLHVIAIDELKKEIEMPVVNIQSKNNDEILQEILSL